MDNIFIESNSQIVIDSINVSIKIPTPIINHVVDIKIQLRTSIIFNSVIVISPKTFLQIGLLKEIIILGILYIFIMKYPFQKNNNNYISMSIIRVPVVLFMQCSSYVTKRFIHVLIYMLCTSACILNFLSLSALSFPFSFAAVLTFTMQAIYQKCHCISMGP